MQTAKGLCVHSNARKQACPSSARLRHCAESISLSGRCTIRSSAISKTMRGGMTTTFDKREEGFEKQFAHDEELRFKAMARRNKLLGLWAAGILGKTGADAAAYAKEVVLADFEESGDNDVMRKVGKDLAGKGISEQDVRAQMGTLLAQAVEAIKKSG